MSTYTNSDLLKQLLNKQVKTVWPQISMEAQAKLLQYLLLLNKWNQAYNLTSVRDPQDMITQHILDSLAVLPYLNGERILDVGTGAGLPGIPLAITQPEREFVLLDSNGKKTRFLTHVIQQLDLKNVQVMQARVENYEVAQCFTTIISRAFSEIKDFLDNTRHLCCSEGQFLAMKGQYPTHELAAINIQEFKVLAVHVLQVPGLNAQRHLVCIAKNSAF